VPFENCVISDPYSFVAGLLVRLCSCHLLTGIRGHQLVYYISDQELSRNELWSVDTVLDVNIGHIKSLTFSVVLASDINLVCSGTLNFVLINIDALIPSTGSHCVDSLS